MSEIIDACMRGLNSAGRDFCGHVVGMFIQIGVLVVVLLVLDLFLRKRARATLRYWIWMLVFVKLLLPPSLCVPTGIAYWFPRHIAAIPAVLPQATELAGTHGRAGTEAPVEIPPMEPSHPTRATTKPAGSLAWQAIVLLLWSAGVLVFTGLMIQRWSFVKRLIAQAEPADGPLLDMLNQCRRRMGIRRRVDLKLSCETFSPAICGLFRPTILIPEALLDRLSSSNLKAIVIHELAHVRRGDLWINSLQTTFQVIYFYNPLVWLANAIVRRVREQAVDEMVLVALGAEAKSYSNTLIDIAEMAFLRASPALRLVGVAESRKSLEGRIRHMMTRPVPKSARVGVAGVLAVAAIGAILLPMAAAGTQTTGQPPFTATLPNGVTVELVGVCNWPAGEPVCWKPDGSPLDRPLHVTKWKERPGAKHYGFMLRIAGPNDLNRSWNKIEGSNGWEAGCDVVDAQGNRMDGHTAAVALLKEGAMQTALQLGFATGPWSTISARDSEGTNSRHRTGVLWSQMFQDPRGTFVVATAEWRRDRTRRIVAVDTEGVMHVGQGGSVAMDNMDQATYYFPRLGPAQIKELQYQVRPFEWIQFENVSLTLGMKTDVQVKANQAQQNIPELPQGIAELFGLSKDDLLAKYGQPDLIFYGENRYSLNNLPQRYFMGFQQQGLSFRIEADHVAEVTLLDPAYVFGNGVRVGDSEAQVKEAFGPDYVVKESQIKDFLIYEQFDLSFEVYKPERIVREINIERDYDRPD